MNTRLISEGFQFLRSLGISMALETWKWRELLKLAEENDLFHIIKSHSLGQPLVWNDHFWAALVGSRDAKVIKRKSSFLRASPKAARQRWSDMVIHCESAVVEIRSRQHTDRRNKRRINQSIKLACRGNSGSQNNGGLFHLRIRPNAVDYKWKNTPGKGTSVPYGNNHARVLYISASSLHAASSHHYLARSSLWACNHLGCYISAAF